MGRLARIARRLITPVGSDTDQWSAGADHCPVCGQELPAVRPGNWQRFGYWRPTDEELKRKCPFHGRSPFNDHARAMLAEGTLPLTRRDA